MSLKIPFLIATSNWESEIQDKIYCHLRFERLDASLLHRFERAKYKGKYNVTCALGDCYLDLGERNTRENTVSPRNLETPPLTTTLVWENEI